MLVSVVQHVLSQPYVYTYPFPLEPPSHPLNLPI